MSPSAASDFDRGRRVGKYEILTRLSIGGMAELYLAYLPGPGGFKKFVALKQILPDVKADDSFVKMFLDEARITAAFNHSNIGQVFDLGEDNQELYLAMEFIAGQNLEQVIKRAAKTETPIPVGFACRVVRDACLGLHYAHSFVDPASGKPMAIVHRDVSPKNVMITYTGDVKMIDFGIAKAKGRLNRTQVGIVKGTSGYMSPEQVRNEPLDGRTDLFAAAVMLHEMLVGERLFIGPTDAAMMVKIVDGEATPPAQVNPYVSPELNDVVLRALEKQRENRFATGKELAKAIEQACPDIYDEEQVAEFMSQLFEDKIAVTRSLFDMANTNTSSASLDKAVQALAAEAPEGGTPRPRKTGAKGATPAPRQPAAQATPRGGMKSRAPSRPGGSGGKAGLSSRNLPRVGPGAKSSQRLPRVESDVGDETIPPRRAGTAPSRPPKRDVSEARTDSNPAHKPSDAESTAEVPPKKSGGLGAILGVVIVLALLGAGGWAVTMGPLKSQAQALLKSSTEEPPPVDTGPKPIDLGTTKQPGIDKPKWVIEKEEQEKRLAEERERQKEIEAALDDPENQAALEEINTKLSDIYRLEEEQRNLIVAAKAAGVTGAANTKRIEDLQKQIDELKSLVAAKKDGLRKPGPKKNEDGVEIVKNSKAAAAADLGYLTLRTVNPSSAMVFFGNQKLGSTPLVKVPLDVGVHKLRVVDGDGKDRLLSVTIEAGKTADFKGISVASLPAFK